MHRIHSSDGSHAVHTDTGSVPAEVCERCKLKWIGPPPHLMRLMGDKVRARAAMTEAGVPILPGTGVLETDAQAFDAAERIGYPVIIKATAGGGGRGMKVAPGEADLIEALHTARTEAGAAFGDDSVYIEKYLSKPRHIELQVFGDGAGKGDALATGGAIRAETAGQLAKSEYSIARCHA